ncbi:MAG: aminoacyl-tRNA hydrolase [Verrucomicrobia bacterium]|nr:aminoacyl-tRNA hydrolase [Verrucomicrobiota bacterium]
MKLVVGLGNPGTEYIDTPHNVGFNTVDVLAERGAVAFAPQSRFKALTARSTHLGVDVLLVKPATYMNRSGSAVALLFQFYKCDISDVMVVVDDVNLPLGKLRVRPEGRSGGHNGLESIITSLGSDGFVRIRVGVGLARAGKDLVSHVLSPFRREDLALFRESTVSAADAVTSCIEVGVTETMNMFNGRTSAD